MGEAFIAEMPRCPVHGQMTYEPLRNLWRCHGWDGEGCDVMVTTEDVQWASLGAGGDLDHEPPGAADSTGGEA